MSTPRPTAERRVHFRRRRFKQDAEIVLICNPRAGGRWKALAGILDSEEARHVRRIVTDSVEDIADAVADLGASANLVCIYGGDGTIQRVLDRLSPGAEKQVHLALLGGGTMNVTSRWCGFSSDPVRNFRHIIRAHQSGDLLSKEVPILDIRTGGELHRGFTFGMGPIVRLLDAYERGRKGKIAAVETAVRAVSAVWLGKPSSYESMIHLMRSEITLDGELLPFGEFAAVFANVTGQINPGVEPFAAQKSRDTFYCGACAVSAREMTLALPFLIRGVLPLDVGILTQPGRLLERLRDPKLLTDARYVNRTGATLDIRSEEPIYTIDGEILQTQGNVSVSVGPTLKLAVGQGAGTPLADRLALRRARKES